MREQESEFENKDSFSKPSLKKVAQNQRNQNLAAQTNTPLENKDENIDPQSANNDDSSRKNYVDCEEVDKNDEEDNESSYSDSVKGQVDPT